RSSDLANIVGDENEHQFILRVSVGGNGRVLRIVGDLHRTTADFSASLDESTRNELEILKVTLIDSERLAKEITVQFGVEVVQRSRVSGSDAIISGDGDGVLIGRISLCIL